MNTGPSAFSIDDIRSERVSTALQPFEALVSLGGKTGRALSEHADRIISDGWSRRGYPDLPLEPPLPWSNTNPNERAWAFLLHSWDPLQPLLAAYSNTRNTYLLRRAVDVALDWIQHQLHTDDNSSFAWYDMAVGLRAHQLAYMVDAGSRVGQIEDPELSVMISSLLRHAEVLADDDQFAAHSNHGFYQAAGQLAMAKRLPDLPGMLEAGEQAERRVHDMLASQFTSEGVHREHSPDYHRMVLDTFTALITTELLTGREFHELRKRIEDALAWFVLPNGKLAMFGDTDHRSMFGKVKDDEVAPALRFVRSRGTAGSPPSETGRVFPESGYLVARDRWPDGPGDFEDCSYLAQSAAFHSRTHKHADDLTLVWYDHGREILVDAGRYGYVGKTEPSSELAGQGYWYSDPARMYIESTRAHNTVEIDQRDHQRRGRKPYGSALERWTRQAGITMVESHVRHGPVRHARVLFFLPRRWLVVLDWLWDNTKQPHHFAQHFHFAPELEARRENGILRVDASDGTMPPLQVFSLLPGDSLTEPVRGIEHPRLQGWWSPAERRLEPNWAAAFIADQVPAHTFATLLTFGEDAEPLISRVNTTARKGRLGWTENGGETQLDFARPEGAPLQLSLYRP